jgi:hypothetical protein
MVNRKLWRPAYLAIAATLLLSAILPLLSRSQVGAYGLVTARNIKISSSKATDTDVTYAVAFTAATTNNIAGVVIDFCSNSPIIGDACTAPVGFDVNEAGLALANQTGVTGLSVDAATTTNTLILTKAVAAPLAATTTVTVDLGTAAANDGITNPTATNTTFYARILTYDTQAHAQAYAPGAPGAGNIDAGGIALSTANQLTLTSKVQERLTFCVYTGVNCAAGGSTITLGDTNGVLDPAGPYVDLTGKYDVATNASGNVAIRVKGDTLKTGGFDIAAIGAGPAQSAFGTEQFGFCTYQSSGSGLTPAVIYDGTGSASGVCSNATQTAGTGSTGGAGAGATAPYFAFDSANTNTTYGQTFASKAPGTTSQGKLAFLGNISNTTEAGIYQTTLTFIATGTY